MFQKLLMVSLLLIFPVISMSQTVVTVTDSWIEAGQTKSMTADNIYLLDGLY